MCGFCGKLSPNWLCPRCKIKLEKQSICKIEDYTETTSYFDKHIYMFQYSGEIRNAILNYKFQEKSYIYETFVNFLKNSKKICNEIQKYDIIIPIPISKKRLRERGYNQSYLLGKKLANILNIDYCKDCLIKIKDNKPQNSLGQEERKQNVIGVYKIKNAEKIQNKKILLIDDIFTTGSTANECSKMLKQVNVKNVSIFTIAKD